MSNVVWEDFEKNEYGVIRGGLSGQYGDMPPELHMKKLEQTCMYEREDQLDDFFRSTLKDRTPDHASLAQDLPRETQNQVRSEVLNVRHSGARTAAEPIHPDLFLGFTQRDERGYHNSGPDYRKVTGQSRSRGKYRDYINDNGSDWTIPESHRSELRVIRDIRKTSAAARTRYKIFDTAFDGRSVPDTRVKRTNESGVAKTTIDGIILNINDAQEPGQRSDNTKLRSDNIKVGYKQQGDHRFSVAQYGLMTHKQHSANIHSSQYNGDVSQKFDVKPDEVKNRLYVNMIKEVGRRDHLDEYRHETADYFEDSTNAKNVIGALLRDLSVAQQSTNQSADTIDLGYLSSNVKKVTIQDPIAHHLSKVDKSVLTKIIENKNITIVTKTNDMARRNVISEEGRTKKPGDEVQVVVYSRKQPEMGKKITTKQGHRWFDTNFAPVYKRNHKFAEGLNATMTEVGQGVNPTADKVFDGFKKGAGRLLEVQDNIDRDMFNSDPVNDVGTFTPSHRQMAGRSSIRA